MGNALQGDSGSWLRNWIPGNPMEVAKQMNPMNQAGKGNPAVPMQAYPGWDKFKTYNQNIGAMFHTFGQNLKNSFVNMNPLGPQQTAPAPMTPAAQAARQPGRKNPQVTVTSEPTSANTMPIQVPAAIPAATPAAAPAVTPTAVPAQVAPAQIAPATTMDAAQGLANPQQVIQPGQWSAPGGNQVQPAGYTPPVEPAQYPAVGPTNLNASQVPASPAQPKPTVLGMSPANFAMAAGTIAQALDPNGVGGRLGAVGAGMGQNQVTMDAYQKANPDSELLKQLGQGAMFMSPEDLQMALRNEQINKELALRERTVGQGDKQLELATKDTDSQIAYRQAQIDHLQNSMSDYDKMRWKFYFDGLLNKQKAGLKMQTQFSKPQFIKFQDRNGIEHAGWMSPSSGGFQEVAQGKLPSYKVDASAEVGIQRTLGMEFNGEAKRLITKHAKDNGEAWQQLEQLRNPMTGTLDMTTLKASLPDTPEGRALGQAIDFKYQSLKDQYSVMGNTNPMASGLTMNEAGVIDFDLAPGGQQPAVPSGDTEYDYTFNNKGQKVVTRR